MFSKKIRVIYLYLVCLITLGMILGGVVATISNIAEYMLPEKYITYTYNTTYGEEDGKEETIYEEREKNENLKNIIYSITVTAIAIPFYTYHWKKIEQERVRKEDK